MNKQIIIEEWYESFDGEVNLWGQGRLSTFIRLAGCNLRCDYCDTKKSWVTEGKRRGIPELAEEICKNTKIRNLTITGGEPCVQQPELIDLIDNLIHLDSAYDEGRISMETNGTLFISEPLRDRVDCIIMDVKPELCNMKFFKYKTPHDDLVEGDFIKFIIRSLPDFNNAIEVLKSKWLKGIGIAFSPISPLSHVELFNWMRNEKMWESHGINPLLNIQIHKYLNFR